MAVRRFTSMGVAYSLSMHFESYVRMQHFVRRSTFVPFRRFLGDVQREFMQRLLVALHSTLGSCFRDALQEGGADVVVYLKKNEIEIVNNMSRQTGPAAVSRATLLRHT
jgi:hypothetical protein